MDAWHRLLDQIWNALALGMPWIVAAFLTLVYQWIRVRRARLRAERLQLPPSTPPPQPPSVPWYSKRPRRPSSWHPFVKKNGKGGK